MDNQITTVQLQLTHQITIRELQGRWRRVSSLNDTGIEQIWNKTTRETCERKTPKEPMKG